MKKSSHAKRLSGYDNIKDIEFCSEIDKQEINDFLLEKVVKWWLPDDIIYVKELPHGATGKLLKVELREEYKDHLMEK